jgi:hypothetical protein
MFCISAGASTCSPSPANRRTIFPHYNKCILKDRLLVACCLALGLMLPRLARRPDPLPGFPRLILWAWESPQDLRFIKPGSAGIAFLDRTVWLDGEHVRSRPRLRPLRFTPGTDLIAVVRFEGGGTILPDVASVLREVMPATSTVGVRALQIDFDARQSERAWYSRFLRELRKAMPANVALTVTALESWCEEDGWIRDLPVADATPMLFRMGPDDRPAPTDFPAKICRSSVGVSTDELPIRVPPAQRVYVFHPGSWTREKYETVTAQAARWLR